LSFLERERELEVCPYFKSFSFFKIKQIMSISLSEFKLVYLIAYIISDPAVAKNSIVLTINITLS